MALLAAFALPVTPEPAPTPEPALAPESYGTGSAITGLQVLSAADHEPVVRAAVEVRIPIAGQDMLSQLHTKAKLTGSTRDDGRMDLALPHLDDLVVRIDHPNFAPFLQHRSGADSTPILLHRGVTWAGRIELNPAAPPPPNLLRGRVCASWADSAAWTNKGSEQQQVDTWERCADLEAAGSFSLEGLPEHPVNILVVAEGLAPLYREAIVPRADSSAVLEMPVGQAIHGRILDHTGSPVPEAQIHGPLGAETSSQADGSFVLPVTELPVELTVTAPGFRQGSLAVRHKKRAANVEVRLTPGEQLAGTVLAPDSSPLPEITLKLTRVADAGAKRSWQQTVETREGEFRIDLPSPGTYQVAVSAQGYRDFRLPELHVGPQDAYDLGVLGLDLGAAVRGTLVHQLDGRPVAGSLVELLPQGTAALAQLGQQQSLQTVTDERGRFLLGGLSPGRYELRARHTSHAPALERFNLSDHEVKDLGVRSVSPGASFSGQVLDRSGTPLDGVSVRLFDPERASMTPIVERITDAEGRLPSVQLEAGLYRLQIVGQQQGLRQLLSQEIAIPASLEPQSKTWVLGGVRLEAQFTRAGVPVDGGVIMLSQLLDPEARRGKVVVSAPHLGNSIDGYGLAATEISGEVDEEGRLRLDDVPAGPARLTFFGFDGQVVHRRILVPEAPTAELQIDIAGYALDGIVLDTSGLPVAGAEIHLLDDFGQRLQSVYSDPEGVFGLSTLEAGTYALRVHAENFTPVRVPTLSVGPNTADTDTASPDTADTGTATAPVTVVLGESEAGTLRAHFERSDGSAAAGTMVTLLGSDGQMLRAGLTDTYGRRHFEHLPAGEYFVTWTDAMAGTGVRAIRVDTTHAESVIRIALDEGTAGRIGCSVDNCSGAKINGVALYNMDSGIDAVDIAPYLSGVTSAMRFSDDGHLSLGRLSPGRYEVRVWSGEEQWQEEFRILASDEQREIALH